MSDKHKVENYYEVEAKLGVDLWIQHTLLWHLQVKSSVTNCIQNSPN